jgi:hypothetical protein
MIARSYLVEGELGWLIYDLQVFVTCREERQQRLSKLLEDAREESQ